MSRASKTQEFLDASVYRARNGGAVKAITTKRQAKIVHTMLSEYEDGTRKGDTWHFGPGTVEVVT